VSRTRGFLILIMVAMLAAALLAGCTPKPQAPPDEVTLQLKWVHQAQFAGFYLAQEKGYYAQENLKVNFVEGGQGVDMLDRLATGQADFAICSPDDLLVRRSQEMPVTAIAAIYRRSAVVLLSMADSGIVRPQDFTGKTAAAIARGSAAEFEIQFRAMMTKLGLDISQVKLIPYDANYTAFLAGEVQVTPAYSTGGLIRLRQKGARLNLIWPRDYGIHFYSDVLATTDKMIAENPDLVTRFLRASLKGWQDAIGDYEQGIAITMKYASLADKQLQTAMMEAMLPLVHTGEDHIGWMKADVWDGMYQILLEQGIITAPFDVNQAYTTRFLEDIYGAKAK